MSIISIISERCKACYACIRNCPVKAIKVEDGKSRVVEERCISCGSCVRVCSQNAKAIISDVDKVTEFLRSDKTIALIAPSFPASFPGINSGEIFDALEKLGFFAVHEVTLGVEATLPHYRKLVEQTDGMVISSFCPAIVSLIEKYYPHLVPSLAPVDSAVIAAGKVLRYHYQEAKLVFIGPCIAKKHEVRTHGANSIDAVLTFKELKQMLTQSGISLKTIYSGDNGDAYLPQVFPVSGGLAKNLGLNEEALVIDGADTCLDSLKTLPTQREKPKFLDILFCRGCIDGPEIDSPLDPYSRMQIVRNYARTRTPETLRIPQGVNLQRSFAPQPIPVLEPSKNEIRDILKFTFKLTEEDELNCGACGYNTCQEKAVAVYQGLAEIDMCLPYLLHKSRGEVEYYKERLQSLTGRRQSIQSLIGETQRMLEVKKVADRAATGDIHLVVQGESGSGKRMLAQAIHQSSSRRNKPIFEVNCAGLPELMLDADLFGYEEGAFPEGAKGGKPGKLEMAKGGTLILSQVEGLPLSLQAKLIRALQTKEIERIGSSKPVRIDVRIIAVCTVELKKMVAIGKFRADLYYRLNVLSIFLPPLRERAEDIPLLAGYFLDRIILDKSLPPKIFSDEVVKALKTYGWPGNVRELSTTIERAAFISDDPVIRAEHLPHALQRLSKPTLEGVRPLKGAVAELEKELISKALQSTNNNRLAAAQLLGIPRATLYLKLKEYDIND